MISKHTTFFLTATALVPMILIEPVLAVAPVLTGRWGDPRMPQELAYKYPSKKIDGLVVVTFSTVCPLARRLVPHLNDLQKQYNRRHIQFVAVFPNGMDDLQEIADYAVETNLSFPIYKDDPDTPWHQQLGLNTIPATAVLDIRDGYDMSAIVYRGQVNGMWTGGGAAVKNRSYLAAALESFVSGVQPPITETATSGCAITKHTYHDHSQFSEVTYYRDVKPLIQHRCFNCHQNGQAGGELFSTFDSYETVAALSKVMMNRIEDRIMPPWHGTTDESVWSGGFKNDVRLSNDEINLFRAWVEQGCPPGNPQDAPPAVLSREPAGWQIGSPDFVFEMPEPYVVPTFRLDEYQYYHIQANYDEDRYIQAIEMQPGNKAVVHHMGALIGPSTKVSYNGSQAMLQLYGLTGDKAKKLGDWIPGDPFNARTYPPGYAIKLPAGHDIFFEIHYTPTGLKETPDLSKMSIIWADQKPEHIIDGKIFNRKDIRLNPHDGHYEKTNYYQFPSDVLIHALAPHMHFRGKDFTLYKVENPQSDQERRQLILRISAYDFNWQRTYEFQHPIRIKAGETLCSVTHFDNSHYNPNNPDPEATVRFGLQSSDEMLNLRVKFEQADFGNVN